MTRAALRAEQPPAVPISHCCRKSKYEQPKIFGHAMLRSIPGHALHEKGLQRQITVGTLVNSQQRRALAVPRLNRRSTAGQPRVNRLSFGCFVPPPVYIGFPLFVLAKRCSEQLLMVPWRARGTVAFEADRNVGTLVCPSSPRPTVRCALRRPDPRVVCPGFGLGRFIYRSKAIFCPLVGRKKRKVICFLKNCVRRCGKGWCFGCFVYIELFSFVI